MTLIIPYKNILPKIADNVFCAPNATIIGDVEIGEDSSIWFQTVLRGDVYPIRIGARTNIQDLSMGHVTSGQWALTVEDDVTVGHRVVLHGCHVKSRSLIGMGVVLLDGVVIEEEVVIGAGSVVAPGTVIPPRTLALGAPAKPKRDLTPKEIQSLKESADHYVTLAQSYL
jgi:gamma-carbonic anhydrase